MPNPIWRPGSDEELDDLLRRLRERPTASPPPFFYGRVRARLARSAQASLFWLPYGLRRPAYAALLGVLILAVSGDGATTTASRRPAYPVHYALP
ncbi:MAG: hypothetical protein ACRYFK_15160 [Janthinobacterium lividum]